ncbi:MAG: HAD-IA family hydrolase [Actinomycetota bacterium]|nr:HAD-IA family hydrolase [Actinomycetota bacterium]
MAELIVGALLLDLDGTLVDSTASVLRNWQKVAELLDRPGEDLVGNLHGIPGRQVLRIRAPGLSERRIEELNQILLDGETSDTFDVVPTVGAVELLRHLPSDRWAIVTSGARRLALARIAAAGLPVPATLVTADDVAIGKPDPEPYRLGARLIGQPAPNCLVIEDAPAGITSARAAGCRVLGVLTTFPRLDADTVPDLSELQVEVTAAGLLVRY